MMLNSFSSHTRCRYPRQEHYMKPLLTHQMFHNSLLGTTPASNHQEWLSNSYKTMEHITIRLSQWEYPEVKQFMHQRQSTLRIWIVDLVSRKP